MKLTPKNWGKFQHYSDRCPPWIKLHRDLLNDRHFMSLPTASKALAPLLWLLASESKAGCFDATIEELEFRLRMDAKEIQSGLNALIQKGFFVSDSVVLAECEHVATPETETETETKGEKKVKPSNKFDARTYLLTNEVEGSLADDWLIVRKAKKAPVTESAMKGIEREAQKAGVSLSTAIQVCVERNWAGFKADWYANSVQTVNGNQPAAKPGMTFQERMAAMGRAA